MPPGEKANEGSVAILLDFENAKDADLHRVLAEAARFGRVTVRRAYADWSRFAAFSGAVREGGFEEVHQFTSGGRGKNSTDIHLVVDAMDLLYTRPVDTFVLVTADSDFAKLARRLREGGKRVIGLGARGRVGRALVQSCDEYVYYDVMEPKPPEEKGAEKAAEPKKKAEAPKPAEKEGAVTPLHRIVLESLDAAADDSGRVYGGPLHEAIRRLHPDFSYRDYGFSSFLKAVESLSPIVRAKHASDVSDFIVWVDPAHEDLAQRILAEGSQSRVSASGKPLLDEEVQRHIDAVWRKLMGGKKRLAGRRAAEAVSLEYGVTKLSDTPLGDLDGVLESAPGLAEKWKRDGSYLVPKA